MRINIVFVLIIFQNLIYGQFSDNFSDGEILNNPTWKGNTSNFKVDDNKSLRLNAPSEGESWLYVNTNYPDSFELSFKLKMEFSPSTSNASKVYFLLDSEDYNVANGYYLQLGENGSSDRVKVYKTENGQENLIAEGLESSLSKDPSICNIKMTFRNGKDFSLLADYDDNGSFDDNIIFEDQHNLSAAKFFGLNCVYTSTRVDKFVFDDIYLKAFELDKTKPNLVDIQVLNSTEITLIFDENIKEESAISIGNYLIDNGVGSPLNVFYNVQKPNQVVLLFSNEFTSTDELTLTVANVSDLSGNVMEITKKTFLFAAPPKLNDIVLTEVLFNPYTDAQDFIELYNASDNYLELKDLIIKNLDNNQEISINTNYVLAPKKYVAITEDEESLIEIYKPIADANIMENDLPSLNNDEGVVMIYGRERELLDSFNYNEKLHFQLIDDEEGVSLEKINLSPFDNSVSNWHSSSRAVNFATPGYKNSNSLISIDISEEFKLEKKIFSPDGDSKDDLLILIYNLPESGYVANLSVYSSEGYLVKNLTKNELLGREGIITWDGTNDDGDIAKLGIYIIVGNLFDINGNTKALKKDCVLATFID